ncbi:MAG: sigma-54-dependent Fis family transcriptional regulator, partial [bacterium]
MGKKLYLSASERDFFSLVNRAIIANPFSDERIQLDLEIARMPESYPIEERTAKIIEAVSAHTQKMGKEGTVKFTHYAGEDYILVKNTFLFEFFHRFIDKFDHLILAQIEAGDRPIKVPFAHEVFSFLEKRGFIAEEIHRYFALCYQLRRAFFFIYSNLVGRSPCMKELRKNLWNNVFTHDLGLYDHYLLNR